MTSSPPQPQPSAAATVCQPPPRLQSLLPVLLPPLLLLLAVSSLLPLVVEGRHRHDRLSSPSATVGGTMCPNCLLAAASEEEEGKYYARGEVLRLEAIKEQILTKLGLSARPNVSGALPKELVLQTLSRAHEGPPRKPPPSEPLQDDYYATTSEIITFAEPGGRLNGQRLLEFPVPQERSELRVKSAVLWLRMSPRPAASGAASIRASPQPHLNVTLWAFRLLSQHLPNATHLSGKDLERQTELVGSGRVGGSGWQKLDLTRAISDWYRRRQDRLRLLIDCSGCGRLTAPAAFGGGPVNRPFLAVRAEPRPAKRVRRRALDCLAAPRGSCCKQRFYVSFKQLGWDDWVIAPSGYYANYCRGDCSGRRTPDTFLNHYSHVIEEYRKTDRLAGLRPCCAPVKFSSTSLIYYGPDMNIIKRDLPKMVVEECGCP